MKIYFEKNCHFKRSATPYISHMIICSFPIKYTRSFLKNRSVCTILKEVLLGNLINLNRFDLTNSLVTTISFSEAPFLYSN